MAGGELLKVAVQLSLVGADDEELDRLARQLRQEMLELDVETVELAPAGAAAAGVKGLDPVLAGVLLAAVGPAVLTQFLDFLHAWAMRREGRVVKLKIQAADGAAVELEVPQTTKPAEVQEWIRVVQHTLAEQRKQPRK